MAGPGTVQKKIAQLPVLAEARKIGRIKAWSTRTGKSAADLVREALWGPGWGPVEAELIAEYGELSETDLLVGEMFALPAHLRADFAKTHKLTRQLNAAARKAE